MQQPRTNNRDAPRRTSATTSMMVKCKWRTSKAKLILVADLESKLLPLHETEMSAEVAWNKIYKDLPDFKDVVTFDQFRKYLNDHRKQVKKRFTHTEIQEEALAHDRKLYRRRTHNDRGELVFDFSTAKALLQLDVKNKLHTFLSSSELQATRPEYGLFKKSKFKERIVQEVRRQKFLHYLDAKRSKKFVDNSNEQRQKDAKNALAPVEDIDVAMDDDDAMDDFDAMDDDDAMDEL